MILQQRVISYEDVEIKPEEVMSLKEVSQVLEISIEGASSLVDRGRLTELVDPDALSRFKNRRFALRSEVEELAARRKRAAEKWEGVSG